MIAPDINRQKLAMSPFKEKKALVTVPRFHVQGGVTNFFEVLRPSLNGLVGYLEVGRAKGAERPLEVLRRLIEDTVTFDRELAAGAYNLVHLNPSLCYTAVLRDAILVLVARRRGIPVLVFFHGWEEEFAGTLRGPLRWAFKAVFGRAATIVVLASAFKDSLVALGVEAPIVVLRTAVPDPVFGAESKRRDYDCIRCLFLSRLVQGKGADVAIRAFALLKKSLPHATLTIAGDGPERLALERLVAELDVPDVTFTGHVSGSAKEKVMQESNLFLFPSSYGEGLPTALIEAMAYGLPVITTVVGGVRDFFEDGRMGAATTADPAQIAEHARRMASTPAILSGIGGYNRQYAATWFAASSVARDLVALYERIRSLAC